MHAVMHYMQKLPTLNRNMTTGVGVVMKATMACKTIWTSIAQHVTIHTMSHLLTSPLKEQEEAIMPVNICTDNVE